MPSISDVAAEAGVSIKTVSRVLNREPNVRDETRQKVDAAIASLGYRPKLSARSLASGKSYCLALFCTTPRSEYFSLMQFGAVAEGQLHGHHIFVVLLDDHASLSRRELRTRVQSLLQTPMPDGVLLPPPFCDDPVILGVLDEASIPCARISPRGQERAGPYVCLDDERAAYDITKHLIDLGHRRIAHVQGDRNQIAALLREAGFRSAMRDAGLTLDESLIVTGNFHFPTGLAAGERLFSLPKDQWPTAIFSANDEMAAGVCTVVHRQGLDIPGDVSITGFDDTLIAELVWPPLTTIRQPIMDMAAAATRVLIDGNCGEYDEPVKIQLDYELVVRASTGPLNV